MSGHVEQDAALESLAARYRAGTAPERFTASLSRAVDRPRPGSPRLPAAVAAAVLAAVALLVSLPVDGPDAEADHDNPRWRVSTMTPERPAAMPAPAPMRVALTLSTPRRPSAAAASPDAAPPPG